MGAEESAGGDALAGKGALARAEALCGAAVAGALQAARVEARAGRLLVAAKRPAPTARPFPRRDPSNKHSRFVRGATTGVAPLIAPG